MQKIIWNLPIKTVSEANCSEHWAIKSKRHKMQQFLIRSAYSHESLAIGLPCVITMVRLSPRSLDDDNLTTSFKFIRDELSQCILRIKQKWHKNRRGAWIPLKGRHDNDPRITWQYRQEKSKEPGIRIEIEFED